MNLDIYVEIPDHIPKGVRNASVFPSRTPWSASRGRQGCGHADPQRFLRHRNSVAVGVGEILDDIAAARKHRINAYR